MDTWLWIVIWALVIAGVAGLWLRERRRGTGWGASNASSRGTEAGMRIQNQGRHQMGNDGGGGVG